MMGTWRRTGALTLAMLGGCGPVPHPTAGLVPAGSRYVAMGSSYAAGSGIAPRQMPATRCNRSAQNYAGKLARQRRLSLVDVSCGGATTAHVVGPWRELAPQVDSITADTRLVTVTIGGNDVAYVGGLVGASCMARSVSPSSCPRPGTVSDARWRALAIAMHAIATEVHRRAPGARLVFVDYLTVLPRRGACAAASMDERSADLMRAVAARLAAVTAQAAREGGAELVAASRLSEGHDVCSAVPWMTGFPYRGGPAITVPYHPNEAGMAAIAAALDRLLGSAKRTP